MLVKTQKRDRNRSMYYYKKLVRIKAKLFNCFPASRLKRFIPEEDEDEEKDDIPWSWEEDAPSCSPSRPMCAQSFTPSPTNFSPSIHSLSLPLSSSPNKETTTHMWTDFVKDETVKSGILLKPINSCVKQLLTTQASSSSSSSSSLSSVYSVTPSKKNVISTTKKSNES